MPLPVRRAGFFGKLPARGDFVRAGLPRSFVDPWDLWLRHMLPASQTILAEGWEPAWLEAPVWRFALPAGLCGPDAVAGLWMPSVDQVGRYFPLMLARIGGGETDLAFLDAAEAAGRLAITEGWTPEQLLARLGDWDNADCPPGCCARWWTQGSPRRSAWSLNRPEMPDATTFALMLDERASEDMS